MVEKYKIMINGTKTFFLVDKELWAAFVAKCKRLKKRPADILSEILRIHFEGKKVKAKKRKNG